MSLQTDLKIRRYSSGEELSLIEDRFLRRDYGLSEEKTISLTSSRMTVPTSLSTIQFVYMKITGSAADVNLYRGSSPEWWQFDDAVLMFGISNCTSISLKASTSTTVYLYIAGE